MTRNSFSTWLNTNQKMLVCGMLQEHICNDYWTVFLYHGPTFPVVITHQFLHMHCFWLCFHEQIPRLRIISIGKNILIFHCVMLSEFIKPSDSKFITSVLVFCATLDQYRFLAIHLLTCMHTTLLNVTCSANAFWIYWHLFKYCKHQDTLAALYNWYPSLETNWYWYIC